MFCLLRKVGVGHYGEAHPTWNARIGCVYLRLISMGALLTLHLTVAAMARAPEWVRVTNY